MKVIGKYGIKECEVACIAIIFSILMIICLSGCQNTETEMDYEVQATEISLPDDHFIVGSMEHDDQGRMMLGGAYRTDDLSATEAAIWRQSDKDGGWKKIFSKTFYSEKPGEMFVESKVYFTEKGAIICEIFFPADNIFDMHQKLYYIKDLENGVAEQIFKDRDFLLLLPIHCFSENNVYAFNSFLSEVFKIDLTKGTIEKIIILDHEYPLYEICQDDYMYFFDFIPENRAKQMLSDDDIENMFLNDPETFYETYVEGIKYDIINNKAVESEVAAKFGPYYFTLMDQSDYSYGISLGADAKKDIIYFLYDKGLFKYDENGETLLYSDKRWQTDDIELNILSVDEGNIYIEEFSSTATAPRIFKITV